MRERRQEEAATRSGAASANAQTESTDRWVCAYCSHRNDFEADSDVELMVLQDGDELPFRCTECGKVCLVTTEVVQVRYVAEPADDQSHAVNDDEDDFQEEDEDDFDDEEFDEDDFEEEDEEDFDDLDDEDSDDDESAPTVDPVATASFGSRHLIELHANNPTVTSPVKTGWERTKPGRVHPACKGLHTVEDGCRGIVEPCARCGRPRCFVEGTSSLIRLCNDCWSAVVTKGAYWPTLEAVERRRWWLREEWQMPRWWMWTTKLAEAVADEEAECERIDQINCLVVELPVQAALPAISEPAHD